MVIGRHVAGNIGIFLFLDVSQHLSDNPAALGGVQLHDLKFLVGQLPGLLQDIIGNDDLADVVHRRGLDQKLDILRRQGLAVMPLVVGGVRDQGNVGAGALDVRARIAVAALDQVRHADDGIVLDRHDAAVVLGKLRSFLFQLRFQLALVFFQIGRHADAQKEHQKDDENQRDRADKGGRARILKGAVELRLCRQKLLVHEIFQLVDAGVDVVDIVRHDAGNVIIRRSLVHFAAQGKDVFRRAQIGETVGV